MYKTKKKTRKYIVPEGARGSYPQRLLLRKDSARQCWNKMQSVVLALVLFAALKQCSAQTEGGSLVVIVIITCGQVYEIFNSSTCTAFSFEQPRRPSSSSSVKMQNLELLKLSRIWKSLAPNGWKLSGSAQKTQGVNVRSFGARPVVDASREKRLPLRKHNAPQRGRT